MKHTSTSAGNNNNNNNNQICKAPECQKTSVALNERLYVYVLIKDNRRYKIKSQGIDNGTFLLVIK